MANQEGKKEDKRPSVFCYPFLSAEDNVGVAVAAVVWAAEGTLNLGLHSSGPCHLPLHI